MQSTKEGYLLTRNVIRVDIKANKVIQFIKVHKLLIIATTLFLSLVIAEGVLLNKFVSILKLL